MKNINATWKLLTSYMFVILFMLFYNTALGQIQVIQLNIGSLKDNVYRILKVLEDK